MPARHSHSIFRGGQDRGTLTETGNFNNAERITEGWYWAMRADQLRRGRARALSFLGREMVVYRGADGRAVALDAYCPHMGAHLAEGKVEGNAIRCLFHYWKYDADGRCIEIPCQAECAFVPRLESWPVAETYGLIWIWAGRSTPSRLPFVPELEHGEVDYKLANRFTKCCHPNVMMINAIDAQHFNSVHRLPVNLQLEPTVLSEQTILFQNTTSVEPRSWFTRLVRHFYRKALVYVMSYWFGSTGTVTIGPDALHFHIIFALRPTADGRSEGQTILVTRKRRGLMGKAWSQALLWLTRLVAAYFAKGDTRIFETIRFNLRTPIKADAAILEFIKHVERQPTVAWGLPVEREQPEKPANRNVSHPTKLSATR
jgi:phenylpropionate dioxygenase-like ring-hydroxylating dioxygenase large terminal subunit